MNTKIENLRQSNDLKLKSSSTLSFRLCFYIFNWSLLTICLAVSVGHAEVSSEQLDPTNFLEPHLAPTAKHVSSDSIPEYTNTSFYNWEPLNQIAKFQLEQQTQTGSNVSVNFASKIDKRSSHLLIAKSPNTQLGHLLWQSRISVLKDKKDNKSKHELQRIIEQIQSVEFELQTKASEPLIAVKPIQNTEPDNTLPDAEMPGEPDAEEIESKSAPSLIDEQQNENQLQYKPITSETLQIFEDLSQQPEQLKTPFELAEVLFYSGHLKEAAMCYQEALKDMTSNKIDEPKNLAWILFQSGNCLRNDDPSTAMEMYRQLISEYPDSPWVDLAKIQSKLINLFQQDKPRGLINELTEF